MSDALFVSPNIDPQPIPGALALLSHSVRQVFGGDQAIQHIPDADTVIIDGRSDLRSARVTTRLIMSGAAKKPSLLLIAPLNLPVLNSDWGISDFILTEATPAEWETRLQLLVNARQHTTIVGGSIVIDESAYAASLDGKTLNLTYTEFELLRCLATHPGRVLSREELLKTVWGYADYGGTRTVDVHIRRLRAKLGPEYDSYITTVRNVGYRFNIR